MEKERGWRGIGEREKKKERGDKNGSDVGDLLLTATNAGEEKGEMV